MIHQKEETADLDDLPLTSGPRFPQLGTDDGQPMNAEDLEGSQDLGKRGLTLIERWVSSRLQDGVKYRGTSPACSNAGEATVSRWMDRTLKISEVKTS